MESAEKVVEEIMGNDFARFDLSLRPGEATGGDDPALEALRG
jgi:hypothetical protein